VDFDIFAPPGLDELGFQVAWKRLQATAQFALVWTPRNEGHWIALRSKLIRSVYREYKRFSSTCGINVPKSMSVACGLIPTMFDPPKHTDFRQALNRSFSALVADPRTESMMRQIAVDIIEPLVPKQGCNFTTDYAEVFPIKFILGLFDLPFDDHCLLKKLVVQMTRPDGSMSMEELMTHLYSYADPVIDARFGGTGTDLITLLINSRIDGRAMTRDEMRGVISLLIVAGIDTVVNMLGFFFEFLAGSPKHRRELVADPTLTTKAVEEMLRRFPIVAECRVARMDTEIDATRVMEGEMICAPTVLAGLDDQANECPMDVDFRRKRPSHQTFGEGVHLCVGQGIARLELKVSVEEWLKRIPEFSIAAGYRPSHRAGSVATVLSLPLVWGTRSPSRVISNPYVKDVQDL
jgi:cytochrome P450